MGRVELDETAWENGRGYRKNQLADETMLGCPGTLVQIVVIAPHDMIPDHVHHTSFEYYTVLAGTCRLVINDDSYHLTAGDMFLMRPGDVHRLYNEADEPFTLLVFKTNAPAQDTFWT